MDPNQAGGHRFEQPGLSTFVPPGSLTLKASQARGARTVVVVVIVVVVAAFLLVPF